MLSQNRAYRRFEIICLLMILLMSPFIITETSPLYQNPNPDNTIFLSVAKGMTEGKTVYVDLIENKGPLFFMVQALFQWMIPGITGIFVLEVLVLLGYALLVMRLVRLLAGEDCHPLCVLLPLAAALLLYNGSNFSEEYDLVLTLAGMNVVLQAYAGLNQHRGRAAFWLGLCTAGVLCIKMSDILVLGVSILFFFYESIRTVRSFRRDAVCFLLGLGVVVLPVCLYLAWIGALMPMIEEYIINNLVHISVGKNTGFWASRMYIITHGYGSSSIKPVLNMAVSLLISYRLQPKEDRCGTAERKMRLYAAAVALAALLVGYVAGSGFRQHLILEQNTTILAIVLLLRALRQRLKHSGRSFPMVSKGKWLAAAAAMTLLLLAVISGVHPEEFVWQPARQADLEILREYRDELDPDETVYRIGSAARFFWYNDVYPAFPYYNLTGFIQDNVGIGLAQKFEEFMLETPVDVLIMHHEPEYYRGVLTDETIEMIQTNYEVVYESNYDTSLLMRLI